MTRWYDALRDYRQVPAGCDLPNEPSSVMFVLCSEDYSAAALVAACAPALVLQVFGGARNPGDAPTRSTFEHAILTKGVRHVVVCGHQECQAVAVSGTDSRRATQAAVVSQCVGLRDDKHIGPLLHDHRVTVRPIWFDALEGDVFLCNFENERVELMSDADFSKMLSVFATGPR